jgi:hypothetical protein
MCHADHRDMGLWAAWSLLRYLPQTQLVLHADGAFPSDAAQDWSRLFPGLRILTRQESLSLVQNRLGKFGAMRRWSETYHCGLKLGGFHAAARTDQLIEFDADTLVLRQPKAALDWVDQAAVRMLWNRDHRTCYAYPWPLLRDVLDQRIGLPPELLNGGFVLAKRLNDADWEVLEYALNRLEADRRTDPLRYWMHQTLLAILASNFGNAARPLPDDYGVRMGPTSPEMTMRHFVGHPDMRPRFFTEGIGQVIVDAIAQGQLPGNFPQRSDI